MLLDRLQRCAGSSLPKIDAGLKNLKTPHISRCATALVGRNGSFEAPTGEAPCSRSGAR